MLEGVVCLVRRIHSTYISRACTRRRLRNKYIWILFTCTFFFSELCIHPSLVLCTYLLGYLGTVRTCTEIAQKLLNIPIPIPSPNLQVNFKLRDLPYPTCIILTYLSIGIVSRPSLPSPVQSNPIQSVPLSPPPCESPSPTAQCERSEGVVWWGNLALLCGRACRGAMCDMIRVGR